MAETPKPNGRSKLREEFISWKTARHSLLVILAIAPLVGALWAWTSSSQAHAVEMATTLTQHMEQNCDQHGKYDKLLESTTKAIEMNSRAIDKVSTCMEQHLVYEKETGAKLDVLLIEQRQMLRKAHDSVIELSVEQRVLKDEIKRLASEVKKNGTH